MVELNMKSTPDDPQMHIQQAETQKNKKSTHYEKCTSVMGGNELKDPFLPN